jgi:hypothetical protein
MLGSQQRLIGIVPIAPSPLKCGLGRVPRFSAPKCRPNDSAFGAEALPVGGVQGIDPVQRRAFPR